MPANHREIEQVQAETPDRQELLGQLEAQRQYVHHFCWRFLANEEDAKDAAQDVIVLACQNLHRFRNEASLKTWLYRIARNHCLNRLRGRPTLSLDDETFGEVADESQSPSAQVEDHVLYQQLLAEVMRRARARKPPWDTDDYLVFEAYYGGEKRTWPEVATILGKKVDTVKFDFYQHVLPTLREIGEEIIHSEK